MDDRRTGLERTMTVVDSVKRLAARARQLLRLDEAAVERLEEEEEERLRRLENNPFAFASWEAFVRFRRSRGKKTRRPPRDPRRDPYASLHRRRRR